LTFATINNRVRELLIPV